MVRARSVRPVTVRKNFAIPISSKVVPDAACIRCGLEPKLKH
jgi:hypothetical protein